MCVFVRNLKQKKNYTTKISITVMTNHSWLTFLHQSNEIKIKITTPPNAGRLRACNWKHSFNAIDFSFNAFNPKLIQQANPDKNQWIIHLYRCCSLGSIIFIRILWMQRLRHAAIRHLNSLFKPIKYCLLWHEKGLSQEFSL